MKCPPGCRVAVTVLSQVKRHVECKRVLWELNLKCTGATVTVSQSRRRSSVACLRGQAIRVYAVCGYSAVGGGTRCGGALKKGQLPSLEKRARRAQHWDLYGEQARQDSRGRLSPPDLTWLLTMYLLIAPFSSTIPVCVRPNRYEQFLLHSQ